MFSLFSTNTVCFGGFYGFYLYIVICMGINILANVIVPCGGKEIFRREVVLVVPGKKYKM